jgi:enoyl-CoA hydratase/carnithine racemase
MTTEPSVNLSLEDRGGLGRVARIVVDYQARLNILNSELIAQLTSLLAGLRDDERLRLVILTGAGDRAFIGGADINEMVKLDEDSARAFITRLHEACAALRTLPVPAIARISGYCLGAGLEVAASCDLRVATERSSFGMPEVKVGIPSVIEAALLPRLMGWGKAARLIYTGETISAHEAAACGLKGSSLRKNSMKPSTVGSTRSSKRDRARYVSKRLCFSSGKNAHSTTRSAAASIPSPKPIDRMSPTD